jgi:hypothetical protein
MEFWISNFVKIRTPEAMLFHAKRHMTKLIVALRNFAKAPKKSVFQTKVVEKIKTHFMFSNFFPENRAVDEIMWKNISEPDRSQMTMTHAHYMLHT